MGENCAAGGNALRSAGSFPLASFFYAAGVQWVAQDSLIPVTVGSAVICTAFFSYIYSGSPRWKGAPGLFGHANRNAPAAVKHETPQRVVIAGDVAHADASWTSDSSDEGTQHSDRLLAASTTVATASGTLPSQCPRRPCVDGNQPFPMFSAQSPFTHAHTPPSYCDEASELVFHSELDRTYQKRATCTTTYGMPIFCSTWWPKAVTTFSQLTVALNHLLRSNTCKWGFYTNCNAVLGFSLPSLPLYPLPYSIPSGVDGIIESCNTYKQFTGQAVVQLMGLKTSATDSSATVDGSEDPPVGAVNPPRPDAEGCGASDTRSLACQCVPALTFDGWPVSARQLPVAKRSDDVGNAVAAASPSVGSWVQGATVSQGEVQMGRFLGRGRWGKVFECFNTKTGERMAVKQLVFDGSDPKVRVRLKELQLELEVLKMAARSKMPWIVGFHGVEKKGSSVLLFMEYCDQGSLLDYMAKNTMTMRPTSSVWGTMMPGGGYKSVWPCRGGNLPGNGACDEEAAIGVGTCSSVGSHLEWGFDRETFAPPSDAAFCGSSDSPTTAGFPLPDSLALPIREIQRFTRQTVEALQFLHSHGFVHLDVKTANILITGSGDARLADFGCCMRLRQNPTPSLSCAERGQGALPVAYSGHSAHMAAFSNGTPCACSIPRECSTSAVATRSPSGPAVLSTNDGVHGCYGVRSNNGGVVPYPTIADDELSAELRGTALYIAPEVVRFERNRIGAASDVWSVGCVAMELATGAAPWQHLAKDRLCVMFRVASTQEELPLPPRIMEMTLVARRWLSHCEDGADVKERCTDNVGGSEGFALDEAMLRYSAMDVMSRTVGNAEERLNMQLLVSLGDFLQSCLRIRPEERPSCEEMLRHPFLATC